MTEQFVYLLVIAAVNLVLGFGIATAAGRGPWSHRARCTGDHQPVGEAAAGLQSAAELHPPSPLPPSLPPPPLPPSPVEKPLLSEVTQATGLVHRITSELEQAERRIERIVQAGATEAGDGKDLRLDDWLAMTQELARRFQLVTDGLQELPESFQWTPELLGKATNALESLSALCAASCADGHPQTESSVRRTAQSLLDACREARGTMNAVLFYQSQ